MSAGTEERAAAARARRGAWYWILGAIILRDSEDIAAFHGEALRHILRVRDALCRSMRTTPQEVTGGLREFGELSQRELGDQLREVTGALAASRAEVRRLRRALGEVTRISAAATHGGAQPQPVEQERGLEGVSSPAPTGQGPVAQEGASPASAPSLSGFILDGRPECDAVAGWLNAGMPPGRANEQAIRDHVLECPGCGEVAMLRALEARG